jgi:ATP-dependent DNA helicase RecQ
LTPDEELVVVKILACVARMSQRHTQAAWSVDLLVKTLLGSKEEKVRTFGFDLISTWGLLGSNHDPTGWTAEQVQDVVRALVDAGALEETFTTRKIQGKDRTYREVGLTEKGSRVMRKQEPDFTMVFPNAWRLVKRRPLASTISAAPGDLMKALRDTRTELAAAEGVPAYVVASNKLIEALAESRPVTQRTMLSVKGMGDAKFARYGSAFLQVIRDWAVAQQKG